MAHASRPAVTAQAGRLLELSDADGDLPAEERARLEARLEQLRAQLEELARDRFAAWVIVIGVWKFAT